MEKARTIIGVRYSKRFIANIIRKKNININIDLNSFFENHKFCPICRSDEYNIIAEVDRVGMPTETVVCNKCDFVFNNSYIKDPKYFYKSIWGDDRWGDPEINYRKRTATDAYSWKRFAYIVKKLGKDFDRIEHVLEIGCGDGCNLLPYHLTGKSVVGCDLDSRFLTPGKNHGMELIEGDLSSIPKNRKFDLIMLIHSFEHMINLDELVHELHNYLKPHGHVFVEVPGILNWNRTKKNLRSDMGLRSSNNFLGYIQFQHNYHFDLRHLKLVWERNNFQLVDGDEWVRAIFNINDHSQNDTQSDINKLNNDVISYLKEVENDFLKLSNLVCGFLKLMRIILCAKK